MERLCLDDWLTVLTTITYLYKSGRCVYHLLSAKTSSSIPKKKDQRDWRRGDFS
ncbi:hypothetical protein CY34DRAFT_806123 [Suillus luteus UH-Slu-Lm8-n1]|uniref:Uncharacterized protein n=1 Tax=Suillus luteus UH-Slu-Lm8-n1 TaxID=930992 RepID=A0A0D0AHT2_9AGAM|nr:hypothetical protein CY34DRAFT_806123 [Suillus luteus UH-Slu-Lm8-n1]